MAEHSNSVLLCRGDEYVLIYVETIGTVIYVVTIAVEKVDR
jgi:hypothetical protein